MSNWKPEKWSRLKEKKAKTGWDGFLRDKSDPDCFSNGPFGKYNSSICFHFPANIQECQKSFLMVDNMGSLDRMERWNKRNKFWREDFTRAHAQKLYGISVELIW